MSSLTSTARALALGVALALVGCASAPPRDDTVFLQHQPRSILVLPPLDHTLEPAACYGALATVTRPLAELGYYVFPVAVVDAMMRQNGLPTSAEMQAVPLAKLNEIFGADAVLYLSVEDWGTSYQVLTAGTTVTLAARLIDTETGLDLWHQSVTVQKASGNGGGGLGGLLVNALATQLSSAVYDPTPEVAREAAHRLFLDPRGGLLRGPLHPEFGQDRK
ncbi:MAG: DUF799 family lipoprotein [Planctomycetota bacterium]